MAIKSDRNGAESPYDLGDTDPEPVRQHPPKDPETGRFVKQTHNQHLLQAARRVGLTNEEIEASSSAELRQYIEDARLNDEISGRTQRVQAAVGRAAPKAEAAVEAAQQRQPFKAGVPGDVQLEDWMQRLVERVEQQDELIYQLQEQLGQVRPYAERAAQREAASKMDKFFNRHSDIFGEGEIDDIDQGSPEYRRRTAVYGMLKAQGVSLDDPDFYRQAEAIKNDLFGGGRRRREDEGYEDEGPLPRREPRPQTGRRGRVVIKDMAEDEARLWRQGGLQVPGHRKGGRELSGYDRAIQNVRQYQRDNAASGDDDSTTLAEFPDYQ